MTRYSSRNSGNLVVLGTSLAWGANHYVFRISDWGKTITTLVLVIVGQNFAIFGRWNRKRSLCSWRSDIPVKEKKAKAKTTNTSI